MHDYYKNAYRVTRCGVPCRVFIKGRADGVNEIKIASKAGCGLALENHPNFNYEPAGDRHDQLAGATAYRAPRLAPKASKYMRENYYAGHKRKMVGGVPCRVNQIGKDASRFRDWAALEYFPDAAVDRLEAFREELIERGSYEAAGVRPPAGEIKPAPSDEADALPMAA